MSNYCRITFSGSVLLKDGLTVETIRDRLTRRKLYVSDVDFRKEEDKFVMFYKFADEANYGQYELVRQAEAFLRDVERHFAAEAWEESTFSDSDNGGPCSSKTLRGSRQQIAKMRLRQIPEKIAELQAELKQLREEHPLL